MAWNRALLRVSLLLGKLIYINIDTKLRYCITERPPYLFHGRLSVWLLEPLVTKRVDFYKI